MSDLLGLRSVSLERTSFAQFRATNAAGVSIEIGEENAFSPVELLLAAIAACSAMDVDYIVSKKDEPESFRLHSEGTKVRDEGGNHLVDIQVTFDARFADTDAGAQALERLPRAIQSSHDRLCAVTRTVVLGADVTFSAGEIPGVD